MSTTVGLILTGAVLLAAEMRALGLPHDVQEALRTGKEIYVATRRTDGSRSSAAPVWFWSDGNSIYFSTSPRSHKARRIRRGSPVFVSVVGADGPFFEARPELVTDPELVARMGDAYANKYWIAWLGLFRPRPARVRDGKTLVIKVVLGETTADTAR